MTLPEIAFLFSVNYEYENETLPRYVAYVDDVSFYITELANDEGKVKLKSNCNPKQGTGSVVNFSGYDAIFL